MDALEVSISRIIARFAEDFKTGLHQLDNAAAQNSLLTKEVGLGLGPEGCLQDTCAGSADGSAVCQSLIKSLAGCVLLNSDQHGNALAFLIFGPNRVTRSLRSDHGDIDIGRRNDLLEMDVETVSEHEHIARFQVGLDLFFIDLSLEFIRRKDHDDISLLCCFGCRKNSQSLRFSLLLGLGAFIKTNDNIKTGLLQIQCMSMSLGSITDNRDLLAFQ